MCLCVCAPVSMFGCVRVHEFLSMYSGVAVFACKYVYVCTLSDTHIFSY